MPDFTREEIAAEIRRFVLDETLWEGPAELLTEDYPLLASGQLDSFDLAQLVTHLERRYEISIGTHELAPADLDCIGSISTLFASRQPETSDLNRRA